jgi:CelD/BcsL family acetyltransferase involved in cellulose biosynthesis
VGLAPLFLHPWNGRRQVTFLGNGVSDRLRFVLRPGHERPVLSQILDILASERERWDLCDLQDIHEQSILLKCDIPDVLHQAVRPQYVCTGLRLPDSPERLQESLPHGLRRNVARYRRHLADAGDVEFTITQDGDCEEAVDALIRLHRARWQTKEGTAGMLDGAAIEEFHRAAARNLSANGSVRLNCLRFNGDIAAIAYVIHHGECAYGYMCGFDPSLARFSPGALIVSYALECAILEGMRFFDFLRGGESYKSPWGAEPYASYRLLLWHGQPGIELA